MTDFFQTAAIIILSIFLISFTIAVYKILALQHEVNKTASKMFRLIFEMLELIEEK